MSDELLEQSLNTSQVCSCVYLFPMACTILTYLVYNVLPPHTSTLMHAHTLAPLSPSTLIHAHTLAPLSPHTTHYSPVPLFSLIQALMHTHTLQSSAIVGSTLLATIEQLAFNVLAPNEDGLRTSNIGMGLTGGYYTNRRRDTGTQGRMQKNERGGLDLASLGHKRIF